MDVYIAMMNEIVNKEQEKSFLILERHMFRGFC